MKIIADTHTHTLATDHAYSTLTENAAAAAKKGLKFLAVTEHSPSMPGGPSLLHFMNLPTLPNTLDGVIILKGAEVNIMDYSGSLDLPEKLMENLDWVIASYHTPNIAPSTKNDHTKGWLAIAENPHVDVVGHCGDQRYAFDHPSVLKAFADHGKIVEINAHSFGGRPGSKENCPQIARRCAALGVPIVVSTDAHFHAQIGDFTRALEVLAAIAFPEELVLNADYHRFLAAAKEKAGCSRAFLESLQ